MTPASSQRNLRILDTNNQDQKQLFFVDNIFTTVDKNTVGPLKRRRLFVL